MQAVLRGERGYGMDKQRVHFQTSDEKLQKIFDGAETQARKNIRNFDGRRVMIEGGGYQKIWLETQPMGGEMYAKRDMEIGMNNQLLFMEFQREDGRIPGSIALIDGKIVPQFDKFQGFCFPAPALNMYYLGGKDREYLNLLGRTLERFDAYLWRVRDSNGDGCLESWCQYDTGEDNALRYGDAPGPWEKEYPPPSCKVVPMASMDIMSYSYASRETLAKICYICGDDRSELAWTQKAQQIREKIGSYLWNERAGACFDRDKHGQSMKVMIHNNLRCMYWHSFTNRQAQIFVERHLVNPEEFWTKLPLPSVAVNDPLFRNIRQNNWSGQVEALTYQRAIRALENYGYHGLLRILGQKFLDAVSEQCIFVQQFDPFTGTPSVTGREGYGPAILAVLEYISRIYGVHIEGETIFWGCPNDGTEAVYEQEWNGNAYRLAHSRKESRGYINGKQIFTVKDQNHIRVTTDLYGQVL